MPSCAGRSPAQAQQNTEGRVPASAAGVAARAGAQPRWELPRFIVMKPFIEPHSTVRRIWGDPDLVLLIFAGSAAEFALNKAVDWLFFTNRLPQDPLGRLFSTVRYAQRIVFANEPDAQETLVRIRAVHEAVEQARGERIPDWAYRDVLYMLVDYSQRAYELMYGRMHDRQELELYAGFVRVGQGLGIADLPRAAAQWRIERAAHLARDLVYSEYTKRLYDRYQHQLGPWRYRLLLELQAVLVPQRVRELLGLKPRPAWVLPLVAGYAWAARLGWQAPVQRVLIPRAFWSRIDSLKPAVALR